MLKSAWPKRILALATLPLFVNACGPVTPELAQRIVVVCGTVAGISPAQQAMILRELQALPPDTVLENVVLPDWVRMRDEAKACAMREWKLS